MLVYGVMMNCLCIIWTLRSSFGSLFFWTTALNVAYGVFILNAHVVRWKARKWWFSLCTFWTFGASLSYFEIRISSLCSESLSDASYICSFYPWTSIEFSWGFVLLIAWFYSGILGFGRLRYFIISSRRNQLSYKLCHSKKSSGDFFKKRRFSFFENIWEIFSKNFSYRYLISFSIPKGSARSLVA